MRFVLLHYHILKNAGSTIENILDASFGERFVRRDANDRDSTLDNAAVVDHLNASPDIQAYSSHHIRYPVPQARGYLFFDLCFLRDPIDRIRSMYDYFREKPAPGDPVSELACTMQPRDFVAALIEQFPEQVQDVQTRLLAGGRADLTCALFRMRQTSFLGVVDRFNESVVAGQFALRAAFPSLRIAHQPVNVSRGFCGTLAQRRMEFRLACGEAVYVELARRNLLDAQLVKAARAEVRARFDAVPDGPARLHEVTTGLETRSQRFRPAAPPYYAVRKTAATRSKARLRTKLSRLAYALSHARTLWRAVRPGHLFDRRFYLRCYPGARVAGSALLHYVLYGAYEGLNPHPLFDSEYYVRRNPGADAPGTIPLVHYLQHGLVDRLQPHPLFDAEFYLERNPAVEHAGLNPLLHYVRHGAAEWRKPHALFDPDYYLSRDGMPRDRRINPLIHFLETDAGNPHPLFHGDAGDLVYCVMSDRWRRLHTQTTALPCMSARIAVSDVEVEILFPGGPPSPQLLAFARTRGMAIMWQQPSGVTACMAEPEQLPFFRGVRLDQLEAQMDVAPVVSTADYARV